MDLENTITALIERRYAAAEGSAQRRMAERQLQGLRYSYEEAGGIIEDLDPEWVVYSVKITDPLPHPTRPRPATRTAGSRR
jgi:hypothetical protein